MRLHIAKVLPLLALSFVMAEAVAAPLYSPPVAAITPPSANAAKLTAVHYQNAWSGLIVARQVQFGLPGAGVERSRRTVAEIEPASPVGAAKTSALLLSSLGMLGVISLLRLGRKP